MESDALKAGKERVRKHLIEPLTTMGMRRASGHTVADHDAAMEGICARLAYMAERNLASLAEVVMAHGGGKARDRWPSGMWICDEARKIQEPPPSDSQLVTGCLGSRIGKQARAEGWSVELYLWIKKFGRWPSGDFVFSSIKDDAEKNRRNRHRVEADMRGGVVSPTDARWLDWYRQVEARVSAVMDAQGAEEGAA